MPKTRWLVSYRVYKLGSDVLIHQGWSSTYDKRYHSFSYGMAKSIRMSILEKLGYDNDTHFLEIVSVTKQ